MLILLPPSETKTRPAEVGRRPLDLDELALPALRAARGTMLRAAHRTAAGSDAASRLGVPASSPELVGRMLHLEQEPAAAPLAVRRPRRPTINPLLPVSISWLRARSG